MTQFRHTIHFVTLLTMAASACYFAIIKPSYAVPLSIGQNQQLIFGQLGMPGSQQSVTIDSTGTITSGSEWVVGGTQQAGEFTVGGDAGLIDIEVTNIISCDGSVTLSNFTGTFGSGADPLTNIDLTPATGIQLDGGNGRNMELGATITFDENTPAGGCSINYDIQISYT